MVNNTEEDRKETNIDEADFQPKKLRKDSATHAKQASSLSRMGPIEKPCVNVVSLASTAPILARQHVRTATRKSPHARRHPKGPQARTNASATLATTRTPTTQVRWR